MYESNCHDSLSINMSSNPYGLTTLCYSRSSDFSSRRDSLVLLPRFAKHRIYPSTQDLSTQLLRGLTKVSRTSVRWNHD